MKLNDNFDNIEAFEAIIEQKGFINLWNQFQKEAIDGFSYERLKIWTEAFEFFGLTFDYYLTAIPFDFEIN